MSNELDAHRLIAEVRKRPPLWDVRMAEYKDRTNTPHLWSEIAELLGVDVEQCKRKWKNLRDAYRAEVRRSERRVARLKALGQYDPQRRGSSKWVYFEPMNFINESKRTSYASAAAAAGPTGSGATNGRAARATSMEVEAEGEGEGEGNSGSNEDPIYVPGFHSFCDIKMETQHTTDDDADGDGGDGDDDEDEDDQLFEEFNAVATPQAARRLSDCIAAAGGVVAPALEATAMRASPSAAGSAAASARCKCSRRADEQVHFLEDLEREEQKLMQSTRKEITRANSVGHVGDADYNFLVSFLPQMKKMTELQNLQFRARMSELLLNTMSTPSPCAVAAAAARLGVVALPRAVAPAQQQHHQQYHQQQPQQSVVAPTVSSSQPSAPKEEAAEVEAEVEAEAEMEAIRTLAAATQSQLQDIDDKTMA